MYNKMFRIKFDRQFESEEDPLFNKLKAINFERSGLSQSFEFNYGDFIPVLRPFLIGLPQQVQRSEGPPAADLPRALRLREKWGIAELVNHPAIQSKLRRELDAALGSVQLKEPDLVRLPYLNAVTSDGDKNGASTSGDLPLLASTPYAQLRPVFLLSKSSSAEDSLLRWARDWRRRVKFYSDQ
ncbi:hypothetical protein ZIOFF_050353 [Zingiber officinale]|uniref:Uncharacterized protein n=1 Tax=Zingiber officinale TaxID=94328 RepID=A0A8J5FQY5_ZINOF|nr:hypothetical protein ZIOFF_050353 [Zingiber officinale]